MSITAGALALGDDIDLAVVNPVRTCVGCRGRGHKADLVRLVVVDGRIVTDERQVAPGRGAYLHRRQECRQRAFRQRSLARALRIRPVDRRSVDPERLEQELAAFGENSADGTGVA